MRFFACGLVLLGVASACSDSAPAVEGAASEHTAGEYAWSNEPLQWIDSTYGELRVNRTTLPDEHRIARRMQAWADRIDAIVRSKATETFREPYAAPRPRVKIVPDEADQNAWVSSLAGCSGAGVSPPGEAASPPLAPLAPHESDDESDDVTLVTQDGMERARPLLLHPSGWPTRADFAAHVTRAGLPCPPTLGGGGHLTSPCASARSAHLAIAAASPFIHMTTALLADVDEIGAVFLLAHELAHFYRAHPSPLSKRHYRFWYEVDPDEPGRPLPSAQAALLEASYREMAGKPASVGGPALPSRYPPRVRRLVVELARSLAARSATGLACHAVSEAAAGTWTSEILQRDVPTPDVRAAYLAFEAKLAECAPRQALTPDSPFDPGRLALLAEGALARLPTNAGESLEAFLERAVALAREADARHDELHGLLADNRIGLYTHEQEADDLALEIMARLGVPPEDAIRSWIAYARASEAHIDAMLGSGTAKQAAEAHGTFDAETCARLADEGFVIVDSAGRRRPVFVSLGDLGDAHHADCYRIYNLRREAHVHRYVTAAPPAPLSPPYAELAAEARSLRADAP